MKQNNIVNYLLRRMRSRYPYIEWTIEAQKNPKNVHPDDFQTFNVRCVCNNVAMDFYMTARSFHEKWSIDEQKKWLNKHITHMAQTTIEEIKKKNKELYGK